MRQSTEKRKLLAKEFDTSNFDNDLAFGCFSLSTDFNFRNNRNVKKLKKAINLNETLTEQREIYGRNFKEYEKEVDRIMGGFSYQIVVYDEKETFQNIIGGYPFEDRKSIAGREQISLLNHHKEH